MQKNPRKPDDVAYRYELDINLGEQTNVDDLSVDINIDESREIIRDSIKTTMKSDPIDQSWDESQEMDPHEDIYYFAEQMEPER